MNGKADMKRPGSKVILSIGGSDPSGGAGIQADLKTFTVLGVYSGAVVTCITVQNTTGVFSFQPLDAVLIQKQIECVINDLAVSHVKIGMVGSAEVSRGIGMALAEFQGEVIFDPVLRSSTDQSLTADGNLHTLCENVLARSTVLTPNLPELAALTASELSGHEDIIRASVHLLGNFQRLRAIIVKGGHGDSKESQITDYLICRKAPGADDSFPNVDIHQQSHPRIHTRNDHGTGCTFASAFAAFHLRSGDDTEAFRQSVSFMNDLLAISASCTLGHGKGPLAHHLMTGRQGTHP